MSSPPVVPLKPAARRPPGGGHRGRANRKSGRPALWKHSLSYHKNWAMARKKWPDAPELRPDDRILLLAPHPDDEAIGAGGLLARARALGLPVRLVFLTNGDGSQSTRLFESLRKTRRYPNNPETFLRLAAMRQKEALDSAAALSIEHADLVFLGYPDGFTRRIWEGHRDPGYRHLSRHTRCDHSPYSNSRTPHAPYSAIGALNDVIGAVAEFRPTLVITTHPADTHSDHRTAFELCATALERLNRAGVTQEWAVRCRLYTFLVHFGVWPVPSHYRPELPLVPPASLNGEDANWLMVALSPTECAAKRASLEAYRSQLAITPRYLRAFLRRNELYAAITPRGVEAEDLSRLAETAPM